MPNGDITKAILKSTPTKAPPKPVDPRSDLLKAIRDGQYLYFSVKFPINSFNI